VTSFRRGHAVQDVRSLKRIWWHLRDELRELLLLVLAAIPLTLGVWARRVLMPRFLRAVGKGTTFQSGFYFTNPERISVGSNCTFARGAFITGGGGVQIGDWVGFGPDVKVWSVNHRYSDPDMPYQTQGWDPKPVEIQNDVWLGANVFVMPGVVIGQGAIVSACSVVARSVPPYALIAGNPARVVGWRRRPAESSEAASHT
jgi:acetyltransferase-like isoleucine patch superfamily enzyme